MESTRQRGNEMRRLRSWCCQPRDVVGSLPLQHPCGSLWPTAAFGEESERQLKRAPAELAIHIQQRERESGRAWERELWKLLPAFHLLFAFFSVYFCLGFLSHFLLHSAVPCSEREKCGGGGRWGDVCFVVLCANLDNLLACKQFNRWSAELAKCHLCCSKKKKNVAYFFGLSKVQTLKQFVWLSIVRAQTDQSLITNISHAHL